MPVSFLNGVGNVAKAGAVEPTRFIGGTTGGAAPTTGTHAVGDYAVDGSTGNIYICQVAGTPGTWVSHGPRSSVTPQPLGAASAGNSGSVSRDNHVHAMPSATDVGAIANVTPGTNGNVLTSNGTAWTSAAATAPSTEIVSPLHATGNTGYADSASYWGQATTGNGWPVNGFVSGFRKGTVGVQRLQSDSTGQTQARYWNATAWSSWAPYLDAADFTAKGSLLASTAANAYAELTAGANNTLLVADSTQATGLKWTNDLGGGVIKNYNTQVTTNTTQAITLAATDNATVVRTTTTLGGVTITLPNNMTVGYSVMIVQASTQQISFTPAAGATRINRQNHIKSAGQYAACTLIVTANGTGTAAEWLLTGDTAA